MNSGIYKITSPTNKIYIGQSINIIKRWPSIKSIENSLGWSEDIISLCVRNKRESFKGFKWVLKENVVL